MYLRVLSAVLFLTAIAHAADVRGTVVNSQGGEPLANVRVLISDTRSTTTAADGSFSFAGLMVGDYTLRVEAIGFWLQRNAVHIADQSDVQEYSIALVPEGARRNETLDVHADRFTGPEPAQASAFTLTGAELRDAATVLAADPLRSVQAMPGVTSSNNNDFFAQFTVRGADYSTVGVYLDGVQLRQPFHGIPYMQDGASVSLLSPDTLDSLTLIPTSFSERYSDATGAALDARTRDGAATAPVFRLSVGIAESHFAAEGRLPAGLGSWLLAARKSYMGYLLRYSTVEPTVSVSFYDVSSKLVFQVAPRHVVDAYILDGHAALSLDSTVSPNQVKKGDNTFTLARLGWRWSATPALFVAANGAFIRHQYATHNRDSGDLRNDYYGEWAGSSFATWSWSRAHVLEAGYGLRRLRDSGDQTFYYPGPQRDPAGNGTGLRQGGYLQQSSSLLGKRLELMAGVRWDRMNMVGVQPVSPQASASLRVLRSTSLQFGFGRYLQFGEIGYMGAPCPSYFSYGSAGVGADFATRATHYTAGIEQRIAEAGRVRIEFYDREDEHWVGFRSVESGRCTPFVHRPELFITPRLHSRGVEITLQRRSSNRLSGWISYTYGHTRSEIQSLRMDAGSDQRHTLNVFGVYRLRPTINLSGKWLYGSGYPVDTEFAPSTDPTALPQIVRQVRLGPYERLDLRADKLLNIHGLKVTLYGEVINLTNHRNLRVTGLGNYDPVTQRFPLLLQRAAGFIPAAGVSIEF